MKKNRMLLLLIALMCIAMMAFTACGGGSGSESTDAGNSEEATQEETAAAEDDFLIGSWFAEKSYKGEEERDPDELFGGTFYLVFSDDGTCQMCIDQKRAPLTWERNDEGVLLKGDDTYQITFPDDSQKTLVITINGFDTLMEKYEEE